MDIDKPQSFGSDLVQFFRKELFKRKADTRTMKQKREKINSLLFGFCAALCVLGVLSIIVFGVWMLAGLPFPLWAYLLCVAALVGLIYVWMRFGQYYAIKYDLERWW